MKVHLVLETNFVMRMAKGQDVHAAQLLAISREDLRLLLPSVCLMEAWVAHESYEDRLLRFAREMNSQIEQARRNHNSNAARALVTSLEQTLELQYKHNDEETRNFRLALQRVCERADLISSPEVVEESLAHQHIEAQRDNLVFCEVLLYARQNPTVEVVLLTHNSNDFAAPANAVGIRYFARTSAFLGWFGSLKS